MPDLNVQVNDHQITVTQNGSDSVAFMREPSMSLN
jgi:hypothetical protein